MVILILIFIIIFSLCIFIFICNNPTLETGKQGLLVAILSNVLQNIRRQNRKSVIQRERGVGGVLANQSSPHGPGQLDGEVMCD